MGSKCRIAKQLIPAIQSFITKSTVGYLEPFVGGANVIDKIKHTNRIGYDIHPNLIALLQKAQDGIEDIPNYISEDEYNAVKANPENYDDWYVGLVGFCTSFGSKYFGGYARHSKGDKPNIKYRNPFSTEAVQNLKQQATHLEGIHFDCLGFEEIDISKLQNHVIYCDIPYRDATKYFHTKKFPYDVFYEWCLNLADNNIVLISEYTMPDEFNCLLEIPLKLELNSNRGHSNQPALRMERLFTANRDITKINYQKRRMFDIPD